MDKKKIVIVKTGLNLNGFDDALNNYADAGYLLHTVMYVKNAGYVMAVMTLRDDCTYGLKPESGVGVPEHSGCGGSPVADRVEDSGSGDIPDQAAATVSEPVADIVSEPVADIVSEPVADIVSEPVADIVSEPVAGAMEAVPAEEMGNVPNAETAAAILESLEMHDLSTLADLNELADLNDLNSGEPETN